MKDINSLINKIQDQDSRNVRGGSGTTKKVLEKIVENLEQLNEAGFVTKDVDDLENYNTKTQEAEIYATKQQLGGYYTKEQTDAMLATLGNGSYVVAWDGSSEPVVANIPAGVTVTYDGTDYTGTLDASASTKENIYLVGQDMYITSVNDSTYSWLAAGTTELDLSGYATDAELSQLEAKVVKKDNDTESEIKDSSDKFAIADSDGNAIAEFDKDGLKTTKVSAHHLNGSNIGLYDDKLLVTDSDGYVVCMVDKNGLHATKINSLGVLKNSWAGKVMATYGDSITAVNNGDFEYPYLVSGYNWGLEVAKFFSFAKNYGRGIGSTCFKYRDHGGQVAWVNTTTGEYVGRNDSYTYDNYTGTIPDGCTAIRGDGCSWLRLTSMFPATIRDTIDVVLVMFHNDFHYDMDTDVVWIPNDSTDPEWAASDEYSALGGDYNIGTVKGGIASVVMKLQALMPQATVVLMTPIGGVYSSAGVNSGDFNNTETAKMKKLADVVMDVAQRMSTPTINVYGNCGINTLNRTTYIADNIHPYTEAGRKKIGRAVSSGLISQIAL